MRWLGFDWGEHLYHASDYFEQLYEWAVHLIRAGKAYVDDLSADEIREHRGTLTEPGRNSPWRDRPIEESLDLFARMRAGEFPNGARVLRAKIDMASPEHQPARPGAVPHRPRRAPAHRRRVVRLPDLRLRARPVRRHRGHHPLALHARVRGPPAALRLAHRQPAGAVAPAADRVRAAQPDLHGAVQARPAPARQRGPRARLGRPAHADDLRPAPARLPGRGDPRLRRDDRRRQGGPHRRDRVSSSTRCATCSTGRRPAASPSSIPSRWSSRTTPRGRSSRWRSSTTPRTRRPGRGAVEFSRELWIERDDFMEEPPAKFFRLAPGREVRLRSAYFVTCREVVKDAAGEVVELRCTYDPATRGGDAPDGRRPKATLHWVSAAHAVPAEVRLYDHLFSRPDPGADGATSSRPQPRTPRRCCAAALAEPSPRRRAGRRDGPVRAPRLLLRRTPTRRRARSSSTAR